MSRKQNIKEVGIWIVRNSSAQPKGHFGKYARIAIIEVDGSQGRYVSQISLRARGAKRIVSCSGRLFDGATANSAAPRAHRAAQAECDARNARVFRAMSRAALVSA